MAIIGRLKILLLVGGLVALGLAVVAVVWGLGRPSTDDTTDGVGRALGQRDYQTAYKMSSRLVTREPESLEALRLLQRTALLAEEWNAASQATERLCDGTPPQLAAQATRELATGLSQAGRLKEAGHWWELALQSQPEDPGAFVEAAELLALSGRLRESRNAMIRAVQLGDVSFQNLMHIDRPEGILNSSTEPLLVAAGERWTDDPYPLLGQAALGLAFGERDRALACVLSALKRDPTCVESQLMRAQFWAENGDDREWVAWAQVAPIAAQQDGRFWGQWAMVIERSGDVSAALGTWLAANEQDPGSRWLVGQAGLLAQRLGEADLAKELLDYARLLDLYHRAQNDIIERQNDAAGLLRVAQCAQRLERWVEAIGWAELARRHGSTEAARLLKQLIRERDPREASYCGWSPPAKLRAQFAVPKVAELTRLAERLGQSRQVTSMESEKPDSGGAWRGVFADVTASSGLHFQFDNDHDPNRTALRLFEFTGGGLAVLDYDRDDWPDLFCSQGKHWQSLPVPGVVERGHGAGDQLYRNVRGRSWEQVSVASLPAESGFGQGVATGDIDADGWVDLLVCNLGVNQLLMNNGDGTFRDATPVLWQGGNVWSSSALLADLSGDALDDLYVVTYLGDPATYDRTCVDLEGIERSCKPSLFSPGPDMAYLSDVAGDWELAPAEMGLTAPDGRGLGIVTLRDAETGGLNLFVANDGEPNFFFRSVVRGTGDDSPARYEQSAMACGLAVSAAGKGQACMGVAAGDFDLDGQRDLCITNYYLEGMTYYRQLAPALFADESGRSQLTDLTLKRLGFGTQAIDADLDGDEDLVVANGHEGNYTDFGIPYEMAPQLLENANGRFIDRSAVAGAYFQERLLGRSLATLDWNRDGKMDFAVGQLNTPTRLLENRSVTQSIWVGLSLVGTTSARVPVGAVVTVRWPGREVTRELHAGDGYQASNERVLLFHIPVSDVANELSEITDVALVVDWPATGRQVYEGIRTNTYTRLVEGNLQARSIGP